MSAKMIIAGSHMQYKNYLKVTHQTPIQAIYVYEEAQFRGLKNPEIIKYGTWRENPVAKTDDPVLVRQIIKAEKYS